MIFSADQAIHMSYLHRVLIEVADDECLSRALVFKGGTCAVMLGYLDRFSVDLDFDCFDQEILDEVRERLMKTFETHDLEVKKKFDKAIMYELGYKSLNRGRSTMKVSVNTIPSPKNVTESQYLVPINRYLTCQTIETMFANKLMAVEGRYKKWQQVAARDVYDIHHFFINGYSYLPEIIEDKSGKPVREYLSWLCNFVEQKFNQQMIDEGLNHLLEYKVFRSIRKVLVPETVAWLRNEVRRLGGRKVI